MICKSAGIALPSDYDCCAGPPPPTRSVSCLLSPSRIANLPDRPSLHPSPPPPPAHRSRGAGALDQDFATRVDLQDYAAHLRLVGLHAAAPPPRSLLSPR